MPVAMSTQCRVGLAHHQFAQLRQHVAKHVLLVVGQFDDDLTVLPTETTTKEGRHHRALFERGPQAVFVEPEDVELGLLAEPDETIAGPPRAPASSTAPLCP